MKPRSMNCPTCGCPLVILNGERGRKECERCRDGGRMCRAPNCPLHVHSQGATTCLAHRNGWTPCAFPDCSDKVGPRQKGKLCVRHAAMMRKRKEGHRAAA